MNPLKDDELYHVGKIIRLCDELGMFEHDFENPDRVLTAKEKKRAKVNARSSLSAMANKRLPNKPDGEIQVDKPYKSTYRAWLGKSWKRLL